MKKLAWLWSALLVTGCAVPTKGILLTVDPATPIDHRDLHQYCDLGDQASCLLYESEESTRVAPKFAIVQGIAQADRAVFSAAIPKASSLSWFIYDRDLGRLWKLHDSRRQMRAASAWYVQRIEARQLEPGRTYELIAGDKEGHLIERRSFRTLSADSSDLRFALVSGMSRKVAAANDRLMSVVTAKSPQLVIFTGGNIDAEMTAGKLPEKRSQALDFFFDRHISARNSLAFSRERRLVPVAAIWNESEFGIARGDRNFPFRDQAREVFEMFFPVWADETIIVNGPGVAKSIPVGKQIIALLDDRSFRISSPDALPPCGPKIRRKKKVACTNEPEAPGSVVNRFGGIQSRWAFRYFGQVKQPVWLISAGPWLGLYQGLGAGALASPADWLNALFSRSAATSLFSAGTFALIDTKGMSAHIAILNAEGGVVSRREIKGP